MDAEVLLNRGGEKLISVLFGLGLLIIFIGVVLGHAGVPLISLALVATAVGGGWAMKHDHRALSVLIVAFVAIARYEEGFQVEEVLYALAFFGFLGYWFVRKISTEPRSLLVTREDGFLLLYLVYSTSLLPYSIINGAEIGAMVGEFYTLSIFLIYFPLRQVFAESSANMRTVLYAVLALAVLIALRNFWLYFVRMQSAEQIWQLATGRIVMNEHVLMPAAVLCVTLYLYHRTKIARFTLFSCLSILVAGIIIGQSRALWLAFGLGLVVVFLASHRGEKAAMIRATIVGMVLLLFGAYIIFGPELFRIVFAGLLDRFYSLETAATDDISLVNRFNEMGAVFAIAVRNPIIGQGLGVPYGYYSMVYEATHVTSFVHNGYLHLLYRHGLIGVVLFGGFYFGVLWRSFKGILNNADSGMRRVACISTLAVFIAVALSANSETPFGTADKTLMLAVFGALGVGSSLRRPGLTRVGAK